MRTLWLLPQIGGPFRGCPYSKRPMNWGLHYSTLSLKSERLGSISGPLAVGNSNVGHSPNSL